MLFKFVVVGLAALACAQDVTTTKPATTSCACGSNALQAAPEATPVCQCPTTDTVPAWCPCEQDASGMFTQWCPCDASSPGALCGCTDDDVSEQQQEFELCECSDPSMAGAKCQCAQQTTDICNCPLIPANTTLPFNTTTIHVNTTTSSIVTTAHNISVTTTEHSTLPPTTEVPSVSSHITVPVPPTTVLPVPPTTVPVSPVPPGELTSVPAHGSAAQTATSGLLIVLAMFCLL